MSALDQQLGVKNESGYATGSSPVDRFFEFDSESIQETEGRTEGDPLRPQFHKRDDRFTPYFAGAAGSIMLPVMTKGFGFWLKHMLGAVGTTGPAETAAYTHTGTVADLAGDSFAAQLSRPLYPGGTAQPFLYKGGKVTQWTISNAVDGNLMAELACDFQDVDTATALAAAAYPSGMENLSWAGGVVTIGGVDYDVTEIQIVGSNNLDVDRRQIQGSTLKKEPIGGRREVTFSISADFDSMTQRDRAHADTQAEALAELVAVWTGPTIITGATAIKPKLTVTLPAARFDQWQGANGGPEGISQTLTGVGLYDSSASAEAVEIEYVSADVTA